MKLLNFIVHSVRDESDKATAPLIENKQCIAYTGVEICNAFFYTGVDLCGRNPTPSFTARTAYFHPVFRESPLQK